MNIEKINSYIGQPYDIENQRGWNCWGLVKEIYDGYGIHIPEFPVTLEDIENTRLIQTEMTNPLWRSIEYPEHLAIVAMSQRGTIYSHVGVFLYGGVLHAGHKLGVTHSNIRILKSHFRHLRYYRWEG